MKKDWTIKKLGDVCEIINGKNQREVLDENGPYPIYGSGGVMGYATDFLCRANSVIIGRKGSINNPIFVEEKFWNVDTAFGLQSKENYIPKLLYYFCKSFDFTTHNKGTTIPSLVKSDLLEIPVPLPPLEEQKRIVAVLDKNFAQIETLKTAAEKNLQNTKQLFQAELEKAFSNTSWEKKRLFEICENIVDCPHTTPKKSTVPTDYPCIRTSELKNGEIDWSTMQYLEKDEYLKRITRLEPKENDIVYGREGTFGDAVLLPNTHHFSLGQRTMLLRANTNIENPKFLLKAIISPYVYKQALAKNNGCGVPHVNVADVKNFLIPLPPLEEQKRIVAHLDSLCQKVHQLEHIYTKQLADCDELKQSLLQKAFAWEL